MSRQYISPGFFLIEKIIVAWLEKLDLPVGFFYTEATVDDNMDNLKTIIIGPILLFK